MILRISQQLGVQSLDSVDNSDVRLSSRSYSSHPQLPGCRSLADSTHRVQHKDIIPDICPQRVRSHKHKHRPVLTALTLKGCLLTLALSLLYISVMGVNSESTIGSPEISSAIPDTGETGEDVTGESTIVESTTSSGASTSSTTTSPLISSSTSSTSNPPSSSTLPTDSSSDTPSSTLTPNTDEPLSEPSQTTGTSSFTDVTVTSGLSSALGSESTTPFNTAVTATTIDPSLPSSSPDTPSTPVSTLSLTSTTISPASSGLSGGEIALIVIFTLAGAVALAAGAFFLLRYMRKRPQYEQFGMTYSAQSIETAY